MNKSMKKTMEEEKKSFMDNAKGFLSSWKDDYTKKNKDILERKKIRDEEAEAMKKKMKETFDEVKTELSGKAKDIAEVVNKELAEFSEAIKKGSAEISQQLELEKHLEQLNFFLKDAGSKGVEKFKDLSEEVKNKVKEFKSRENQNNEMDNIKNKAENLNTQNIDDLNKEANKLFDDLENKTD